MLLTSKKCASHFSRETPIKRLEHRLIKIIERTLDVVFSRIMCVLLTITLKQKPKVVTPSWCRTGSLSLCLVILEREPVLRRLCVTPLGSYLRVIVNEFHPNLEKTTTSVLSVIFINLWVKGTKTWISNSYLIKQSFQSCRKLGIVIFA